MPKMSLIYCFFLFFLPTLCCHTYTLLLWKPPYGGQGGHTFTCNLCLSVAIIRSLLLRQFFLGGRGGGGHFADFQFIVWNLLVIICGAWVFSYHTTWLMNMFCCLQWVGCLVWHGGNWTAPGLVSCMAGNGVLLIWEKPSDTTVVPKEDWKLSQKQEKPISWNLLIK